MAINRILGASPGVTFTNVNNIISGSGYLGCNSLTVVNEAAGVIDASGAAGLIIGTRGKTFTNDGLVEAGAGGALEVVDTRIDQSGGGTLQAASGGHDILRSVAVVGGRVTSVGSGKVIASGQGNVLDGRSGPVRGRRVHRRRRRPGDDRRRHRQHGPTASAPQGRAPEDQSRHRRGGATLSGHGEVQLSNVALNRIRATSGATTLTNLDNRIFGSGDIGLGRLTLVNGAKGGILDSRGSVGLIIRHWRHRHRQRR